MWDYCRRKFGDKFLFLDLLVQFHRRIAGGRWWKGIGHSVGVFEFMGEGGGELRATVRDDFVKKSEMEESFVEEKESNPFSGDGFLCRAKNYPLSKPMVYHDQERIKVQGDRKISDEIA